MLRESQWLQRLIRDLLELSRLQNAEFTLDRQTFPLSDLLGDVAMSTHTLCDSRGVVLHCEEPTRDYTFTGDYTRLRQMLLAAADNAVKFTPAGKTVRLWLDDAQPVIGIADEGQGIPPEDMPHIFDRFRSTRSANAEGTGLGLAIAAETARRHGVEIRVQSEPDMGTVFLFIFPQAKP
jgi:signal transduction histidine kinase